MHINLGEFVECVVRIAADKMAFKMNGGVYEPEPFAQMVDAFIDTLLTSTQTRPAPVDDLTEKVTPRAHKPR